jgi:cytochrome c nitrite reductase small subunit
MGLWAKISIKNNPKLRMICFGATGAFVGMSAYVVHISNAISYMSEDPKACMNCHIMSPHYASWRHSSHATVATCNDCHVPHDSNLRKYYFKAKDGTRHAALFTLKMEPQVIRATEESKEVIRENCVRCHDDQIDQVFSASHSAYERSCIDCHREVPHGRISSLSSTPNAAVPYEDGVIHEFPSKESH